MEYKNIKEKMRQKNKLQSEKIIKNLQEEILNEKEKHTLNYWIKQCKENYPKKSEEMIEKISEIALDSYLKMESKRLDFLEKRLITLNRIETIKSFCTYDENGFRILSDDLEKEWKDLINTLNPNLISEDLINILNSNFCEDSDY